MGAYPSLTIAATDDSLNLQEALEAHPVLRQYSLEKAYSSGSGRLFRTYRVRHRGSPETVAVLKAAWLKEEAWQAPPSSAAQEESSTADNPTATTTTTRSTVEAMIADLEDLQRAASQSAVVSFDFWCATERKVLRNNQTTSSNSSSHNNGVVAVRAVACLRPHVSTTLKDRLSSRPFWDPAEKVYAIVQVVQAVRDLHAAGRCHGHLTADNVGVTSTGRLLLLDAMPAWKKTTLPHNDPTEYLYYFQKTSYATTTTRGATEQTPCSLAPERFTASSSSAMAVTPAMDIFALGCLVVEICLNEACFQHLGQLLAYAQRDDATVLQQRLGKMESSALRAAAKHMLSQQPADRLSAAGYLERLEATGQVLATFRLLDQLVRETIPTPDARLVQCVQQYPAMIWEALGRRLPVATQAQWERWTRTTTTKATPNSTTTTTSAHNSKPVVADQSDSFDVSQMIAETEALLRSLEEQVLPDSEKKQETKVQAVSATAATNGSQETEERSELCQSSLIIYLQIVLSTLRQVQRPASKLVALQLVHDMTRSDYVSDEARLQRIVPVTVSLLHDADPLVRAMSLTVLTDTLEQITVFSPSDAPVISQYVGKRVSHLPADPALLVRIAFARCMPVLAEVAQRFLDVTHAVRIYEAVGGASTPTSSVETTSAEAGIFSDDVTQLLDTKTSTGSASKGETSDKALTGSKALLGSAYMSGRESLYDMVSRWVVHTATDQSEDATLPKRALLHNMGRLSTFFGQQGVMSFLLPQIVTFLNDRKDWHLRAALFQNLTPICQKIGRAGTEEFVLPCLEIGFVDSEEQVIRCALDCLRRLVELGLLSRASLLGTGETASGNVRPSTNSLLERYAVFLIHPSEGIRTAATSMFVTTCRVMGTPETFVFILPILKPLLRFQPTVEHLRDTEKLKRCIRQPWSRDYFQRELQRASGRTASGAWTAVGIHVVDNTEVKRTPVASPKKPDGEGGSSSIPSVKEYLRMLGMHNAQTSSMETIPPLLRSQTKSSIEANLKLAQSVMFPRQDFRCAYLPDWYETARRKAIDEDTLVSEQSTIQSIATLGAVYGISIMGPMEGTTEPIIGAATEDSHQSDAKPDSESVKIVEAASLGQWSAEAVLDPDVIDASLLVSKLKALNVPQLPPKLGEHFVQAKAPPKNVGRASAKEPTPSEWRPRINSLVASSSTISGHKAPVVRLAVSVDSSFFISGSHDGTCCVWETAQLENSVGVLDKSLVYAGHSASHATRINDVAMIEGTHSVLSGDSSGSVHVWRVDMVQSTSAQSGNRTARAIGSSEVRQINPSEGEILAVTHFTGISSSVVIFATQKGAIHSWDLRCAQEPFMLSHSPALGHLTSMALGNDRQWLVAGTNKGYLALWDVRFQNAAKLWRHNSGEKIHRTATSFVPPPQNWTTRTTNVEARPFVFMGTGANECAMFDLISGSCGECFRTISTDSKLQNEELPALIDVPIAARVGSATLVASGPQFQSPTVASYPSINCMVGSVGGNNQSFLLTGGSDRRIRFWDFGAPSRCYTVAGENSSATRPSYERVDFEGPRRLMVCRQPPTPALRETGRMANYAYHGLRKPENHHTDSVMDLKIIDNGLISCSRDCTVKVWR
jgi:phosphoinositide-3-kinase regulatory subunit 4